MSIFDNKDFYPTPTHVLDYMLSGVEIEGKVILEPSAGSGAILDYCSRLGAKELLCCEIHPDLAIIAGQKGRLLERDFLDLTSDRIVHVNLIVMNPPFSADEKHIIHAYEIAPEGCTIISLLNTETLSNSYTRSRDVLKRLVRDHGFSSDLGSVFEDADRKTSVGISMVTLHKPRTSEETEFADFFDMNDEGEEDSDAGVMGYNKIRSVVNRYVGAVKMFDKVMESNEAINSLISPISASARITFGAFQSRSDRNGTEAVSRETFKKELQKSAWRVMFKELDVEKYLTESIKNDLNKFIEMQEAVPFTMGNIYAFARLVVGTHKSRMEKVLVEAFERICSFANTNNTAGEGWKTNSDYKINKKFIHPYACEHDSRWPKPNINISYRFGDRFEDIIKALCVITGENYEEQVPMRLFLNYRFHILNDKGKVLTGYDYHFDDKDRAIQKKQAIERDGFEASILETNPYWGEWNDWGFFRVKCFKKGTAHFEFKDEKVWELFNRRVAEIKGWRLPEQTDNKKKGTERTKSKGVTVA